MTSVPAGPCSSGADGAADASPWDIARALRWLEGRTNFERQPATDARPFKLDRMAEIVRAMGDPQRAVPAVHVAGSKGKGSITRMAASILSACGLRTGAYTSPHLVRPNERLAVDRKPIDDRDLAQALWRVARAEASLPADRLDTLGRATYFEAMTAAAFDHFARVRCQAAVYEVGLGGRLDATNVLLPHACVLASIEREHTAILGDTLEQIAAEKAGILKPGVPAVAIDQPQPVLDAFERQARRVGSPLTVIGRDAPLRVRLDGRHAVIDLRLDLHLPQGTTVQARYAALRCPLPGLHQAANTAAAVAACLLLLNGQQPPAQQVVQDGLDRTPRDGRLEVVAAQPQVLIDGAHTPASVRATLSALPEHAGRLVIVFGCAHDKDAQGMLQALAQRAEAIVCTQAGPRATPAQALAELIGSRAIAQPDVSQALAEAQALAGRDGLVLAIGSFMVAGAVKALCTPAP